MNYNFVLFDDKQFEVQRETSSTLELRNHHVSGRFVYCPMVSYTLDSICSTASCLDWLPVEVAGLSNTNSIMPVIT